MSYEKGKEEKGKVEKVVGRDASENVKRVYGVRRGVSEMRRVDDSMKENKRHVGTFGSSTNRYRVLSEKNSIVGR